MHICHICLKVVKRDYIIYFSFIYCIVYHIFTRTIFHATYFVGHLSQRFTLVPYLIQSSISSNHLPSQNRYHSTGIRIRILFDPASRDPRYYPLKEDPLFFFIIIFISLLFFFYVFIFFLFFFIDELKYIKNQ